MVVILPSAYRDGTVSVTTGTTAVTGSLTLFQKSVLPGDWFSTGDGYFILISEVTDDTHLVLDTPYPGDTVTDSRYAIMLQSDIARMQETSRQLLQTLSNGNLEAFASLSGNVDLIPIFTAPGAMALIPKSDLTAQFRFDATVADVAGREEYDSQPARFRVLIEDADGNGRSGFSEKLSSTPGDWSDIVFLTGTVGPVGPPAEFTAGTATALDYGQDPTITVVQNPDGTFALNIGIPKGQNGTGTGDVQGPNGGTSVNQLAGFADTTGKTIKVMTVLEALTALGPVSAGKPAPIPSAAGLGLSNGNFSNIVLPGAYSITGSYANGPLGNPAVHTGHLEVRNASNLSVTQIFRNFAESGRGTVYKRIGYRSGTGAPWTWDAWLITESTGSQGGVNDSIFALEIADLKGERLGMVGGIADAFDTQQGVDFSVGGIDSNALSVLHFDSSGSGTAIVDSADSSKVWTTQGTAAISTAQSKFGGASLLVNGGTSRAFSSPSSDFGIGTGDFTVEFWVRFSTLTECILFDFRSASQLNNPVVYRYGVSGTFVYFVNQLNAIVGTTTPSVGVWYHVAVSRQSGVSRLFVNGVQEGGNYADPISIAVPSGGVSVGGNYAGAAPLTGNIDELRVSNSARFSSNFAVQTGPYSSAVGGSQGAVYDDVNDRFHPSFTSGTAFSTSALTVNQVGYINYNNRIRISSSQISTNGTAIRLTLKGVTTGSAAVVTSMFAGHRSLSGDEYDMDGNQVQITVGGAASFSVPPNVDVVTDWIPFQLDSSRDIIVSFHTSSGDLISKPTATDQFDWWFKVGSSEAGISDVSGYSQSGSYDTTLVSRIEARVGTIGMTLVSTSYLAELQPESGRISVQIFGTETISVNSDLIAEFSRDGGVSWTAGVLEQKTYGFQGIRIYEAVDIDVSAQPSGSQVRWRVRTVNGKNIIVSGVVVQWKGE